MLFNSLEFLVFLPIVFLVYWFVFNRNLWWQNLFIVVVSYIFYGWWDWKFLLLIALTTFCSWLSGIWMGEKDRETCPLTGLRGHRKFVMVANVVLNLAILGYFKYFNFFQTEAAALLNRLGFQAHASTLKILLPVGISFYTFQALSYSIDVYRGSIKPTFNMVAFFAYVSFFPQLVAGPIERATNLLPQFLNLRKFEYAQAVDGCRQMLWGFFKKMVIADNCAVIANRVFDGKVDRWDSGLALWLAVFSFTIQIYCDFSGYSDIAIGCSRLFGIRLMRNFAYPYFSRDIAEFWRRWHISLSTWFRDYLYIPLGGSKGTTRQSVRNIFAIFLTSGLWHGANWTFIWWGFVHSLCFLPLLLLGKNREHTKTVSEGTLFPRTREFCQMGVTFLIVMLAWVFFRAPNIKVALHWLHQMLLLSGGLSLMGTGFTALWGVLPWLVILFGVEWVNRGCLHGLARMPHNPGFRYAIYYALMLIIVVFYGDQQTFIYFQF